MLGFVTGEKNILKAVYEVITVQRDFGNRSDRKLSRLKYTIDRMGVEAFKAELEKRCGFALEAPKPFAFTERRDYYGWHQNHTGKWYYTLFIENGRVLDDEKLALKTALYEVAQTGKANFRFTCNQNLILADIEASDKTAIEEILRRFAVDRHTETASPVRKSSIACVAFNTCPLALAEAQRYLPSLISKIEPLLVKHDLAQEEISLRMTGCPNGCGRPYVAEIGFVGTAYGTYNLHLGGDRFGQRLNKKYREHLDEPAILQELDQLFGAYSRERLSEETFGDFVYRTQA